MKCKCDEVLQKLEDVEYKLYMFIEEYVWVIVNYM